MSKQVHLLHSIHKSRLEDVLKSGITANSSFTDLDLEIRRNVVYCWLCKEDDKMSSNGQRADYVYVEVSVDESRCVIADMDLCSTAMMYREESNFPQKNPAVSKLIAEAYRISAVPILEYKPGMFWTPEVLVKGDIAPECIRMIDN